MYIDVFNGDADGIFSLIQLRKTKPVAATQQRLVTGVKRDISLVQQISDDLARDAIITILDISFDKNDGAVARVLEHAQSVFYCDHHQAKKLFSHDKLSAVIDTAPTVCTALLVNQYLQNAVPLWAVTAAYGDGLDAAATTLANELGLTDTQKGSLKELGVFVNYNGYGDSESDLHYAPADLYLQLMTYDDPFAVVADMASPYAKLKAGYDADLVCARSINVLSETNTLLVVQLPDEAWAKRISGTYGNILAAENRDKAIVIASSNTDGSLTISLRAPKNKPYGAADVCNQFATGGGREGAAGVNALPMCDLSLFVGAVLKAYP
jgi:hypothetical protein